MLDRHEDGVQDSQVGFVGQKVVGVAGRGEERRGGSDGGELDKLCDTFLWLCCRPTGANW